MSMKLKVKDAGKVKIIELRGPLTLGEGDVMLRDAVRDLVDRGESNLVINMKHVTRLDSAGVGEMIACQKRVKVKDGNIHLLLPPEPVLFVLGLFGLRLHFLIFETEVEAVGSFAKDAKSAAQDSKEGAKAGAARASDGRESQPASVD